MQRRVQQRRMQTEVVGIRPSGSATSAKISPSLPRQAARRPWNAGPYSNPMAAKRSQQSSTSTGSVPVGGHAVASNVAGRVPVPRTPLACDVQGRDSSSSGRE